MYKKPILCTGFGPGVCYECCRQARIPSVPYTAFPPGLVLEAEPNWELGCAFPLKKILDRCPDPGSEPAPKPCWSQTRKPMTSVGGAYTTDSSLKRRHQTLPDFKVLPITTNSQCALVWDSWQNENSLCHKSAQKSNMIDILRLDGIKVWSWKIRVCDHHTLQEFLWNLSTHWLVQAFGN